MSNRLASYNPHPYSARVISSPDKTTAVSICKPRPANRRSRSHLIQTRASQGNVDTDVCIVGAGVIGLATALTALQLEPKLHVALVESKELCAGATGAGQGYIWMIHRNPSSPAWKLAMHSKSLWQGLVDNNSIKDISPESLEWQPNGSMLVAVTEEECNTLQERQRSLQAAGVDASFIDAATARQLEPALAVPDIGGGLLVPGDSQISGRRAAAALLASCKAYGSRFTQLFHEECTGLVTSSTGRITGIETKNRTIKADRAVVMSAGAWTGPFLAQQLNNPSWADAVQPRRGHLLEVPRPVSMPVLSRGLMETGYTKHYAAGSAAKAQASTQADVTFTATTSNAGTLLIGSSRELAGWDTVAIPEVVDSIMQHAAHFLPDVSQVKSADISVRVGLRPFSSTGPMIGPVTDGLLIATGHEGSGLTLAPATAELLCDYIAERAHSMPREVVEMVRPKGGSG